MRFTLTLDANDPVRLAQFWSAALGGRALSEGRSGDLLDHVVMADPEGNEFCVV